MRNIQTHKVRSKNFWRTLSRKVQTMVGGGEETPASSSKSQLFEEAYAVTLQKEFPERFPRIKSLADAAGLPLKAWEGVKVTPQDKDSLPQQGIGTTHFEDRTRTTFNLGVIGAFLAHRKLLKHLADTDAAAKAKGTLIFEDDVDIPKDFYAKLAAVESEIPEDWDIVFLDKYRVEGRQVAPHILKLDKDMTAKKNWGMWCFIVKNSSIKEKILPTMEHMLDVPDIQLNKFADRLNMYLIQPSIVRPDETTAWNSNVSILDKQK